MKRNLRKERNYVDKLHSLEGARQKALLNGNIRKYFVLSSEAGFEIEDELKKTYPVEYIDVFYGNKRSKSVIINEVRQEYLGIIRDKDYCLKKIYERLDDIIENDSRR